MAKKKNITDKHIIIAIGASAGGLQSLTDFFNDVPEDSNYSFILVQHLSPDFKSHTDDLLSKKTNIPITEVQSGETIKKSHIYVIPPTSNLVINDDGKMKLLDKPKGKKLNLPIDILFESLAIYYKNHVVGIIMSGTGSDGTNGIKYIKAHGGLVMVQQPTQAKFEGMPQSAIDTDQADFVLPVEEMFTEISNFYDSPELIGLSKDIVNLDEKNLKNILDLIEEHTDLDFNQYKKPTLLRRMSRRMKILQIDTIKEYYEYLQEHESEIKRLHDDFLIGVTRFFRDKGAWDVLRKHVIPELVKFKSSGEEIKIWDVGCNTGEETYSLAILFLEECKKQGKEPKLKIFATDISSFHLKIASKGVYELNSIAEMSHDYISSYFVKQDDGSYKVIDRMRRMILFTDHNILKDPPFSRVDFAICRNLLIYLQNPVQQRVLKVLHYSLVMDGILMLGTSENLSSEAKYYEEISRKWKIYRNVKITHKSRNKIHSLSNAFNFNQEATGSSEKKLPSFKLKSKRQANDSIGTAILEQFNATTIQVNTDFEILEARGDLSRYATFPKSGFTSNLLKILPSELELPIKTAVSKAKKSRSKIVYRTIKFSVKQTEKIIDLLILPLFESEMGREEKYVITLVEKDLSDFPDTIIDTSTIDNTAADRISDLEEELEQTREQLNKAIEETETSNEELQASNEELLASNEELQSTNEELQSVNEELHTVNNEHLAKMDELAALNADIDNLLHSTNIGVVYLDEDLRVRKFTPAIQDHFSFLKQDVGRHIETFTLNYDDKSKANIADHAKQVMENDRSLDRRVQNKSGRHFLKRITPFKNGSGEVVGVVIAFIDIEEIHKTQEQVKKSEKRFKDFYDSDPVMHFSINANTGVLVECNIQFYSRLGYESKNKVLGKSIFELYSEESRLKASKFMKEYDREGMISNEEMVILAKDGTEIPVLLSSNLKKNDDGVLLTRSTLLDISKLKEFEDELRAQKLELEKTNQELEQFVSICSHDLQEPLSTIRFGSDLLKNKFSSQLNHKGREYVSYIHDASGRLSNQIKALLEHSKLGQEVVKTDVDMSELIEVVKYDLSKSVIEKDAKIHVGKLPVIRGYKMELRLLFQNLISNALKYSRESVAPDVRISSFTDDDYIVFSIADNGMGIAEEDLHNIFTIFNRGNTTHQESGTGVGLAHCEKIVKLHEGKIWVDSNLGVGSTFHIKIKNN